MTMAAKRRCLYIVNMRWTKPNGQPLTSGVPVYALTPAAAKRKVVASFSGKKIQGRMGPATFISVIRKECE
jgi:hypothetical protein